MCNLHINIQTSIVLKILILVAYLSLKCSADLHDFVMVSFLGIKCIHFMGKGLLCTT
jgi:high-affinity Fe2+/Pb2+ permease